MGRVGLMVTFLLAVLIITWDELKVQQRVPFPDRYVHAALVWAVLGVVSDLGARDLAAVFGLGLVLAMAYEAYNKPGLAKGTISGGVNLDSAGRIARGEM